VLASTLSGENEKKNGGAHFVDQSDEKSRQPSCLDGSTLSGSIPRPSKCLEFFSFIFFSFFNFGPKRKIQPKWPK
jgi:hypothetical protein